MKVVCKVLLFYGIILFMSKTILVAGKDLPSGMKLAEGLERTDRRVAVSAGINDNENDSEEVVSVNSETIGIEWNRSSPVSSRTFVLEAESTMEQLDEAILYFDETLFAQNSGQLNSEECLRTSDSMVLCYQYLTMTLLERYEKKRSAENPGTIVFLLRKSYDCADLNRNPSLRNGMNTFASPVVSAAAASFEAFAENIASVYGDLDYLNIVLVKIEADESDSDESVGQWLGEYNDALYPSLKAMTKKSLQWLKPGSKAAKAAAKTAASKPSKIGFWGRRK